MLMGNGFHVPFREQFLPRPAINLISSLVSASLLSGGRGLLLLEQSPGGGIYI